MRAHLSIVLGEYRIKFIILPNQPGTKEVEGVDGYADMLNLLEGAKDEERENYFKWLGQDFDPEFFDLHELQNRIDDFLCVIGEARWGFYHM